MSDNPLPPGAADTAAAQAVDVGAQIGLGGGLPQTIGTPRTVVPRPMPTVEEAFGPDPRPTADEAFGPDPSEVAKSAPPEFWEGHPILNAFRVGAAEGWGAEPLGLSQDTADWLKRIGIFNDYQNNHTSLIRSFNEDIIRPAAIAADLLFNRAPSAALGAVSKPIFGQSSALGEILPGLVGVEFGEAVPRLPPEIARGKDLGTVPLSPGEAASHGEALRYLDPNGVEQQARPQPARQVYTEPAGPPEPPAPAVTGQPAPVSPPDFQARARELAPEVFRRFDEAQETRAIFSDWLDELDDLRQQGKTPAIAALDRQIEEARATALDMRPADRAGQNTLISSLEDQRARLVTQIPETGDTEEMARIRQARQEIDFRMRDLVPQMAEARRQAEAGVEPAGTPPVGEEAAPAATEIPPTEQAAPAPAPPLAPAATPETAAVAPPAAAPIQGGIAGDVARQAAAAGRPPEEAQAVGALWQAHYQAWADAFPELGDAEAIYRREAPRIEAGRGVAPAQGEMELAQPRRGAIRLAPGDAQNTIRLFGQSDASTLIHETGHQWLEELTKFASDERAPQRLIDDAATVRDWLGVKEGEEIPTRAHEKFARGFERYMMEGRAPSPALASVFQKFKDWLTQIYRTVSRLRAPINDDIRAVFDRMLAAPPEEAREPAGSFADIHAADAAFTPPERAHEVAPLIREERDKVAEATAPEVENGGRRERDRAEDTARRSLSRGVVVESPVARAEPSTRPEGGVSEPGAERAGGSPAVAEGGGGAREKEGPAGERNEHAAGRSELLDKAGNIRLDNLNTPEDVNALIREISEANGDFLSERRGTVSDGEVLRLAEAMGLRPEDLDLNRLRNEFSPERILATRKLFVQAATEAQKLAIAAQRGDPGAIMAYAQARSRLRMVQQYLAGMTAEWGRGGRAFRRIEGIDQARSVAEIMANMSDDGRELGQPAWLEKLRAEAARVVRLDSPAKVSGYIHDADRPGLGAMLLEVYTNWLISGPLTHIGYAAANFTLDLWKATAETAAQATMGAIAEGIAGHPIDRVYYGEIGAQLYALMRAQRDGFRAAWDSFKAGQTMPLPGEEAAKTVFTRQQAVPNFRVAGVPVPLGTAVRVPGERMIAPIHSYFRAIGYEQHIGRLAYRQATAERLVGDAWSRRVADLSVHPTPEMMEAARAEATAQTLMGRGGKFTQAIQHIASVEPNLPLLGPTRPLRFVAPFVTIFGNMAEQSVIERSPAGWLAEAVRRDLRGENGPIAQQTIGGRMFAGTALALVGGGLAMEGALVGSGPTDPKERSFWRRIFGMPHSVKIGEGSYDLSRFGVLGMQLAIAADLYQVAHLAEQGDVTKAAEFAVHSIAQNFLDEGFLSGVSQMMQALDDFDRYGARYVANTLASFAVPYSVGMAQIAHQIDPYVRVSRTLTDQIIAKVPWWSESLMPRRDIWGEPIHARGWVGVYHEDLPNDPVDRAFDNLGYYPSMPQRRIQGVELTDKQYDEYVRIAGRAAHKEIAVIIQAPGFNSLPPVQRIDWLRGIIENWRKMAAITVQNESRGTANDITAKANAARVAGLHGSTPQQIKEMLKAQ